MSGFTVGPIVPHYDASKHAVVSMTETLRQQLEARRSCVRVSMLCPGPVHSNIVAAQLARQDGRDGESQDDWAARSTGEVITARMTPTEVGDIVLAAIEAGHFCTFLAAGSRECIED